MSFHYGGKAKDGLNWYAYCGNNPVMYVDPSGWERVNVGYFTLATLTNVEDKSTGVYASLRSISENTFGSSLTWESRGDGGVATYTLETT